MYPSRMRGRVCMACRVSTDPAVACTLTSDGVDILLLALQGAVGVEDLLGVAYLECCNQLEETTGK